MEHEAIFCQQNHSQALSTCIIFSWLAHLLTPTTIHLTSSKKEFGISGGEDNVDTHLNCSKETTKFGSDINFTDYCWQDKAFGRLNKMETWCFLYFSLTAPKELALLLNCKSYIRRTHSFKSAGLYPEKCCRDKLCKSI